MKTFIYTVLFAIIGLSISYLIFANPFGTYLKPAEIFPFLKNGELDLADKLVNFLIVNSIRQKIYISTIFGAVTGFLIGIITKRKR